MDGHQGHHIAVVHPIQIGVQRNLLQKAGQAGLIALLHIFEDIGFKLPDVLNPGLALKAQTLHIF